MLGKLLLADSKLCGRIEHCGDRSSVLVSAWIIRVPGGGGGGWDFRRPSYCDTLPVVCACAKFVFILVVSTWRFAPRKDFLLVSAVRVIEIVLCWKLFFNAQSTMTVIRLCGKMMCVCVCVCQCVCVCVYIHTTMTVIRLSDIYTILPRYIIIRTYSYICQCLWLCVRACVPRLSAGCARACVTECQCVRACQCVCVCPCVRACVPHACVRARLCMCECVCV